MLFRSIINILKSNALIESKRLKSISLQKNDNHNENTIADPQAIYDLYLGIARSKIYVIKNKIIAITKFDTITPLIHKISLI